MEIKTIKRKNVITVTVAKALFIFISAIIAAAGSSAWASFNISRSLPFRVQATENDVLDLKKEFKNTATDISSIKTDVAVTKNDIETMKENIKNINSILSNWEVDK